MLSRQIMKTKSYLIGSVLVASLGGLLFGFDTIVISGTTDALKELFHLNPFWLGFTVASALIGTIVGSVAAGRPSDAFGRRGRAGDIAVLYLISAIGCGFALDWYSLLFFRFVGGLAIGGASVVSPMYIAEISPARLRGRLVAVQQFNIVLGCLLAFLSNYLISQANPGTNDWRWMLGVVAVPAVIFLVLLLVHPRVAALAGGQGTPRRGPPRLRQPGQRHRRRGRGSRGHSGVAGPGAPSRGRAVLPPPVPQADPAGRGHRHVQPAFRRQRPVVLRPGHFPDGRRQPATRPCSCRSCWAW